MHEATPSVTDDGSIIILPISPIYNNYQTSQEEIHGNLI